MTRADDRRLGALADRALAEAGGGALEQLVAEASRSADPGAVLARAFGCSRRRADVLALRNLWLLKLFGEERFDGMAATKKAKSIERFLAIYCRQRWTTDRDEATCPYIPGATALAWHFMKCHAAVEPRHEPTNAPLGWNRIYEIHRQFLSLAVEAKTDPPDNRVTSSFAVP